MSKIQMLLEYSSKIDKITKLENHEGKEITAEELVDQYYADPDKYFEVRRPSAVEKSTTTAISKFQK
jgi:hypothetical protein